MLMAYYALWFLVISGFPVALSYVACLSRVFLFPIMLIHRFVLSCLVLFWFGLVLVFLLNFPIPNHKKIKHCFYLPSFWLGINNLLIMLIFVTNKPVVKFHMTQLQQLKQSFTFILLHRNKRRITQIVECHSLGKYNISIIFTGIWTHSAVRRCLFLFLFFFLIFLVSLLFVLV